MWARRAGAVLFFVAIAVLVDVALTFALENYGMTHEVTWYDYRRTPQGTIDTLVVGSSFASFGVNPAALDEALGSNTYNLSTMAQTLPNSLACINTARKDHNVRRVILCIGPSSLQSVPQYDRQVTFMQAKSLGEPLPEVLQNVGRVALDADNFPKSKSLTWMFPWRYDMVDLNVDAILTNVHNRLTTSNPIEILPTHDEQWRYLGKGYCAYDSYLDYNTLTEDTLAVDVDTKFLPKNTGELETLLDTCAQAGIEAYVVVAPRPSYVNLSHQNDKYHKLMKSLQELVTKHGATYMDFNLTKPEFYRPDDVDFGDSQHLNIGGSERFSQALGKMIAMKEAGENTDELLYSYDQWDEYLASYEKVAFCYCETTMKGDEVRFKTTAITRPDIKAQYRFDVAPAGTEDFVTVRDYTASPKFTMPKPEQDVTVRAVARAANSEAPEDAWAYFINLESREDV